MIIPNRARVCQPDGIAGRPAGRHRRTPPSGRLNPDASIRTPPSGRLHPDASRLYCVLSLPGRRTPSRTPLSGRLDPDASAPLRIAARAQHIRRWEIPRDTYPNDRAGYRAWRTDLGRFHARTAAAILTQVGYDEPTIARVRSLLRKEQLKTDPECQLLEDVICLVFLENHFEEFARQHDEEKLLNIVRRTWNKMSERGHKAALDLPLPESLRMVVDKALAGT